MKEYKDKSKQLFNCMRKHKYKLDSKLENEDSKGAIIFFWMGGGHEKAGGSQNFFHEK